MYKFLKLTAGTILLGMLTMVNAEVYELRTYTAAPGKMENLKARFRDHALPGFAKHGLKVLAPGLLAPVEGAEGAGNTIIYILVHKSREEATKNWAAFQADPDWVKARNESVKDGPITVQGGVKSVFLETLVLPAK
jgi:hypothetical protein